jgi:hypothetical protein
MRALVTGIAALTAAVALGVGVASAASPVTVSVVGCYYNLGGNTTVPAGSEVIFRVGWADKNRGYVKSFLKSQTTTADIDGTPVANASGLWGPITKVDKKFYVTFWRTSGGTLANPGDSVTINYQVTLNQAVSGTDPNTGKHTKFGPGPIFPADFHCTVTAT